MGDSKKLGANIRSLRIAYGETQEQLGEAIFVEKNTVSYYENGKREPNKETLSAIANHFMVSVGELLHSDLTALPTIKVNDKDAFYKNIDIILPIVSSENALKNENFKKAFETHKAFYEQLHNISMDGIENIDICIDGYLDATEDDENIEAEAAAAANFISLWYFMMIGMKTTPELMKNKPAILINFTRDENARKEIEDISPSFEADAKALIGEIYDDEMKDLISEMLTIVKRSNCWSDLADYYLALQYAFNFVDNDLGVGFNLRIGTEMMTAFATVKNKYANQFISFRP